MVRLFRTCLDLCKSLSKLSLVYKLDNEHMTICDISHTLSGLFCLQVSRLTCWLHDCKVSFPEKGTACHTSSVPLYSLWHVPGSGPREAAGKPVPPLRTPWEEGALWHHSTAKSDYLSTADWNIPRTLHGSHTTVEALTNSPIPSLTPNEPNSLVGVRKTSRASDRCCCLPQTMGPSFHESQPTSASWRQTASGNRAHKVHAPQPPSVTVWQQLRGCAGWALLRKQHQRLF